METIPDKTAIRVGCVGLIVQKIIIIKTQQKKTPPLSPGISPHTWELLIWNEGRRDEFHLGDGLEETGEMLWSLFSEP